MRRAIDSTKPDDFPPNIQAIFRRQAGNMARRHAQMDHQAGEAVLDVRAPARQHEAIHARHEIVDVHRIAERLPDLCGPEPRPALLHGDAQQHNFISTPAGAVVIDACPYFGHPEADLAQLGFFQPVPAEV